MGGERKRRGKRRNVFLSLLPPSPSSSSSWKAKKIDRQKKKKKSAFQKANMRRASCKGGPLRRLSGSRGGGGSCTIIITNSIFPSRFVLLMQANKGRLNAALKRIDRRRRGRILGSASSVLFFREICWGRIFIAVRTFEGRRRRSEGHNYEIPMKKCRMGKTLGGRRDRSPQPNQNGGSSGKRISSSSSRRIVLLDGK